MKKILLIASVLMACTLLQVNAAQVDTLTTRSVSMDKDIAVTVITPDSYSDGERLPVVYLLNGAGGNNMDWVRRAPIVTKLADAHGVIIVCPNGRMSWYMDSPADRSSLYETYITKELIPWIDSRYRTIASKEGRAITGLSMGGFGSLYLALRNQDIFGAAGSMSGGVDVRPFPENWNLAKLLGPYAENPSVWDEHMIPNLLHLFTPGSLSIIIDCGTEDFFYTVNCRLHELMLERNIQHDFISRPGSHDWNYWATAVKFQILYMAGFFEKHTAE